MSFTIPNQASAAFARQSGLYQADVASLVGALAGDGVLSGLGCTAQGSPNMTVAVAAGQGRVGGYFPYYVGANATITTADTSNPRIDLISYDYNGVVTVTAGTAAAAPVCPTLPANSIPLAQIYVQTSAASIGSSSIIDKRVLVPDLFDLADDFLSSNLSATAATIAGNVGSLGWTPTAAGTQAAPSLQAGVTGHPGVWRSVSGATSGNNMRLHFGSASTTAVFDPTQIARMRFIVAVPTITSVAIKLGLGQDVSDAAAASYGTAGAFVEFVPATSAKWRYTTRQGGSPTTNADTGADVVAGSWYQFDIVRLQNGNWQFAKNGALAFLHSATQPTTVSNIGTLAHTLTATARNLDHDFIGINFAPLGQRWT